MALKPRSSISTQERGLRPSCSTRASGTAEDIKQGQTFRIVDLEGNQAVDTPVLRPHDPSDRYSAVDTIREQGNIYLTTGTRLISSEGNVLLTIVADTCGRHDTLGGACAAEVEPGALRDREEAHAQLPRQRSCSRSRTNLPRMTQARHHRQHQLLHERAGDSRQAASRSRTAFRRPAATSSSAPSMDVTRPDLELPAAQQPLQRHTTRRRFATPGGIWAHRPPTMFKKVLIANRGEIACRDRFAR